MKTRRLLISNRASRIPAGSAIAIAFSLLTPAAFGSDFTSCNIGTEFATDVNWMTIGFPSDSLTVDRAIFDTTTSIPPLAAVHAEGLKFGCDYSKSQHWVHPGGARIRNGPSWDSAQFGGFTQHLQKNRRQRRDFPL